MFVANDKDGNRLYADATERYKECYCPGCGEKLIHKKGKLKRAHFAHHQGSECAYAKDKDSKCAWHVHMQELFPKESREYRFYDKSTRELKYIADVFLKDSNTVIEFQHSPISPEDFIGRTEFHTSERRRIIWVFDESKEGCENGRLSGVFAIDNYRASFDWPHAPRKVLKFCQSVRCIDFCVCVYLGDVEDAVYLVETLNPDCNRGVLIRQPFVISANANYNSLFLAPQNARPPVQPTRGINRPIVQYYIPRYSPRGPKINSVTSSRLGTPYRNQHRKSKSHR